MSPSQPHLYGDDLHLCQLNKVKFDYFVVQVCMILMNKQYGTTPMASALVTVMYTCTAVFINFALCRQQMKNKQINQLVEAIL